MDGAAPRMTTNRIVATLSPKMMIPNGTHAIDGMVVSALMMDPTAARSGAIRDTRIPTTVPMSRARA